MIIRIMVGVILLMLGCTNNNNDGSTDESPKLIGKWKLIAQLTDPGDGSGTFQPVASDRTFEFIANGTVSVNGEMCYMTLDVGHKTVGTYTKEANNDFSDGEIMPPDCSFEGTKIYYKIEGNYLILWYQCIEACGQKFIKI